MIPQHPNVVGMLNKFVHVEELCIVFEYMALSLSDVWTRAQGFLDYWQVVRYGHGVVQAVHHLHSHDVAYRDISMSIVLYDSVNNTVKLADLGLATSASSFVLERPVTALWYRAPEAILFSSEPVQMAQPQFTLDLWSSGCLLTSLWCANHIFMFDHDRAIEKELGRIGVLQKIVHVLGLPVAPSRGAASISAAARSAWLGITAFPRWGKYSKDLVMTQCPEVSFKEQLCDVRLVAWG